MSQPSHAFGELFRRIGFNAATLGTARKSSVLVAAAFRGKPSVANRRQFFAAAAAAEAMRRILIERARRRRRIKYGGDLHRTSLDDLDVADTTDDETLLLVHEALDRFAAERQTLALMGHHGIGQVFDAGATEAGRPYFAMELVRGIPITTFCEEQRLSLEARLQLFIKVCSAVQTLVAFPDEFGPTIYYIDYQICQTACSLNFK